MKISISRYNPETDTKAYLQDYEIKLQDGNHMLLDVILRLKRQDNTLSFRKSCREGVCGSDAMNINGRNGLACVTPVRGLQQPVVLRPLPSFPIIRDLVVDMTNFFKQYHSVSPYLINAEPPPEKERLSPRQSATSSTGLTNASCAAPAAASVRRSGGTRTSLSVLQACFRPTGSSSTAVTGRPRSGSTT